MIDIQLTKEEIEAIINNIEYANSYYPGDNERDNKIIEKLNKLLEDTK
ncbi:MAG: hypothetical protein PHU05_04070 [Bacilli bacterium]|nr:hypothetical protein [Bacilli bacterium]